MSSRLGQAQPAVRTALKGRMMVSGPPGSGKTRSSLIMATDLAQGEPILGIDTEKESMATYADDFTFTHLKWLPPFDPRELAETVLAAGEEYGVIVLDSLSHFWRAQGGTLDIAGGKFTGWKDARPAQEELVEAILSVPAHVIVAVRAKVEYAQEQEASGRHVVRKLGMASVQDDTLEYEMNIAVDLAMDHTATISKTRTTVLPVGRAFRAGHVVELAEIYREWLAGGEAPATQEQGAELVGILNGIEADLEHSEARKTAKAAFLATCGRPELVTASRYAEAFDVAKRLAAEATATLGPIEGSAPVSDTAGSDGPPTADAPSEPPGPSVEAPPPHASSDPEVLHQQIEEAVTALPAGRRAVCREEIGTTFPELSACSVDELRAVLTMVKDFPIGETAEQIMERTEPANEPPLSTRQRGLVSYARQNGVGQSQLVALAAIVYESTEPKPLHELADVAIPEVQRLIDRAKAGEIVFEQPNDVLIAKEVAPA